jgi:HAD superfamily hydrolase (TIGR01662 family)
MSHFIQAILFDLGGTLMFARGAWDSVHERADMALTESLQVQGLQLDINTFASRFRERLHAYYARRDKELYETTYMSVLNEMLMADGHKNITEAGLRSALDAMLAVTQSNWILDEDTIPTLTQLKSDEYRMGIVSNAGDNKDVIQLVRHFQLEYFFDFVLTSAACSYRKPHPRIFEMALAHWNIPASKAIMVGDSLEADIMGAQKVGLPGVWITRRAQPSADDLQRIKPDFSLRGLNELYPALERINSTRV